MKNPLNYNVRARLKNALVRTVCFGLILYVPVNSFGLVGTVS